MGRILRSKASEEDYREIWRFIAADNPDAADNLLRRFDEKLELYARNPGMGTMRENLGQGLRSFPVGNYLIFYRTAENAIELVRVLHGARDLHSIFRRGMAQGGE